ncbi:hypothetical protein LWC08_01780 [Desulfobaculum bizertense]|nr:hypothetical protein [Desulfobaculum bizertense]UIJ38319.1 hypothetical protein LWC08_01780 [Desulfobaculum bizertense]
MARLGTQLEQGANFPRMTWTLLDGSRFTLPDDLGERWSVVILLRGHW